MYISSIFLLALSAGALAFPTTTTTTTAASISPIFKRGKGSIAGFWGSNCYGPVVPGTNVEPRPVNKEVQTCIKFNTPATYIGINWGGPGDRTKSLRAYADDNCTKFLSKDPILAPVNDGTDVDYKDFKTKKELGTNSCVEQKLEWGAKWGSVMYFPNREGYNYGQTSFYVE